MVNKLPARTSSSVCEKAEKEVSIVKEVAIDTEVVSDTKVANEGQIRASVCLIQGQVEKDLQPSIHHTKYEDPAPFRIKT